MPRRIDISTGRPVKKSGPPGILKNKHGKTVKAKRRKPKGKP